MELNINQCFFLLHSGSYWLAIGCIYIVSCQFNAMPNNDEFSVISAERAKLGPNDHWFTPFGEVAPNSQILGMLFNVDRSGETDSIQASYNNGLE